MIKFDKATDIIDNYNATVKHIKMNTLDSLSFALARDVYSNINVPSFRRSAMDGYALNKKNLTANKKYEIASNCYAGDTTVFEPSNDQVVRIMTGAMVPDNCDIVIMQELANEANGHVSFNIPATTLNANICEIGEDIQKGSPLYKVGTIITPTILSCLISTGIFEIEVISKPNVLVLTTGDEVIEADKALNPGKIYNSNMAYITTRLNELQIPNNHIHISDDMLELNRLLNEASNNDKYDLIISTGAISVGEKDILRNFINSNNIAPLIDRVNIMPGGPFAFWEYNELPIISLAGSPFANFVTMEMLATRLLAKMTGNSNMIPKLESLNFEGSYCKKLKKKRFLKAHANSHTVTLTTNNHLASALYEMSFCNCLMCLERGEHNITSGDPVTTYKLGGLYE